MATLAVRAQTLQTEDERLCQEHVWPEDRARSTELPGRTLFHIPGADIRKINKQTNKQTNKNKNKTAEHYRAFKNICQSRHINVKVGSPKLLTSILQKMERTIVSP